MGASGTRQLGINVLLGGILIVVGVLFLLGQVFGLHIGRFLWPFFIIVPGALLFVLSFSMTGRAGMALAIPGSILTMLGLLLLYQSVTGHWASWAYAWALIAPTSIGLGQMVYGAVKGQDDQVKAGSRLAAIGGIIFLAGGLFFELIIGISGFGFGSYAWALLLIVLGGALLVRSLLWNRSKI